MLIRKGSPGGKVQPGAVAGPPVGDQTRPRRQGVRGDREPMGEGERLELLLARYEKNLELESFYIRKKDHGSLLEILPAQGSLIDALTAILGGIRVAPGERAALDRRLAAADAKREGNRKAFEAEFESLKRELEEMNAARLRLKQVRTLSRTAYGVEETVRTESWA